MHAYLANVLRSRDCETLIVGGTSDHMHALLPGTASSADDFPGRIQNLSEEVQN